MTELAILYLAVVVVAVVMFGETAHFGGECDHKRKEPGCNPAPDVIPTPLRKE